VDPGQQLRREAEAEAARREAEAAAQREAEERARQQTEMIARVYLELLGRAPDDQGLQHFLELQAAEQDVRTALIGSDEYKEIQLKRQFGRRLLAACEGRQSISHVLQVFVEGPYREGFYYVVRAAGTLAQAEDPMRVWVEVRQDEPSWADQQLIYGDAIRASDVSALEYSFEGRLAMGDVQSDGPDLTLSATFHAPPASSLDGLKTCQVSFRAPG
jgi:hypothetical protein